ncbi:MAG: type II toxin-antitoxin system VapC family toxin [Rhodospirillaceae bacterium]|nr:type II toxin-antitoxin system VapC family toxin [Rhodospirillaceae bacterium]
MSVLLDTNVVSELLRPSPDPAVESWVAARPAAELHFSAVGEAELRYGVLILPTGRRRDALARAIEGILREDFEGRILPFDSAAARAYADIAAARRSGGRIVALADGQIAAIARARGMAVATRNVRDFEDTGIEVVDPWTAS